MICGKCQTKARYVINGRSERLNYWYCDTCKDEPASDSEPCRPPLNDMVDYLAYLMKSGNGLPIPQGFGTGLFHTPPVAVTQPFPYATGLGVSAPPTHPVPITPSPPTPAGKPYYILTGYDKRGMLQTVTCDSSTPCFSYKTSMVNGGLLAFEHFRFDPGSPVCNCGEVTI